MKKLKITFFSDGGHGWAAVKRELLKELNIMNEISSFSYQKGNTVYLEEDCDFAKFLQAYCSKHGITEGWASRWKELVETKESYSDKSPIRNYARFTINKVDNIEIGMEVMLYGKKYTVMGKAYDGKWMIKGENTLTYRITKTQEDELVKFEPTKLEQSLT